MNSNMAIRNVGALPMHEATGHAFGATEIVHPERFTAIRCNARMTIDRMMRQTVEQLQASGFRVGGFLQSRIATSQEGCDVSILTSIVDGRSICVSQDLGKGSRSCRLDPGAIANAMVYLSAQLSAGIDILVLNRFGIAEARGQGFVSLYEQAYDAGIPVLTAVREPYVAAWRNFGGEFATLIEEDAVPRWCSAVLATHAPA